MSNGARRRYIFRFFHYIQTSVDQNFPLSGRFTILRKCHREIIFNISPVVFELLNTNKNTYNTNFYNIIVEARSYIK